MATTASTSLRIQPIVRSTTSVPMEFPTSITVPQEFTGITSTINVTTPEKLSATRRATIMWKNQRSQNLPSPKKMNPCQIAQVSRSSSPTPKIAPSTTSALGVLPSSWAAPATTTGMLHASSVTYLTLPSVRLSYAPKAAILHRKNFSEKITYLPFYEENLRVQ